MVNKGPTLVILWEKSSNHIFGGFSKDSWKIGPKFYGSNQNFLFNLRPRSYIYEATSFNSNYQYMNVKAKTLPNGIGMYSASHQYLFMADTIFEHLKYQLDQK
jgi:hypothetical protein